MSWGTGIWRFISDCFTVQGLWSLIGGGWVTAVFTGAAGWRIEDIILATVMVGILAALAVGIFRQNQILSLPADTGTAHSGKRGVFYVLLLVIVGGLAYKFSSERPLKLGPLANTANCLVVDFQDGAPYYFQGGDSAQLYRVGLYNNCETVLEGVTAKIASITPRPKDWPVFSQHLHLTHDNDGPPYKKQIDLNPHTKEYVALVEYGTPPCGTRMIRAYHTTTGNTQCFEKGEHDFKIEITGRSFLPLMKSYRIAMNHAGTFMSLRETRASDLPPTGPSPAPSPQLPTPWTPK